MPIPANQHRQGLATSVRLDRILSGLFTIAITAAITAVLFIGASPVQAQEASKDGKQKQMEKRRAERSAKAKERRQLLNDPEHVKQNAWWNQDKTVEQLKLTEAQRKTADAAMATYLETRDSLKQQSQHAESAFYDALSTGTAADLATKRDAMIAAMSATDRATAELRIKVLTALSNEQRASIAETMPRVLRTDWAGGNRRQARTQPRNGQRDRGEK